LAAKAVLEDFYGFIALKLPFTALLDGIRGYLPRIFSSAEKFEKKT